MAVYTVYSRFGADRACTAPPSGCGLVPAQLPPPDRGYRCHPLHREDVTLIVDVEVATALWPMALPAVIQRTSIVLMALHLACQCKPNAFAPHQLPMAMSLACASNVAADTHSIAKNTLTSLMPKL